MKTDVVWNTLYFVEDKLLILALRDMYVTFNLKKGDVCNWCVHGSDLYIEVWYILVDIWSIMF